TSRPRNWPGTRGFTSPGTGKATGSSTVLPTGKPSGKNWSRPGSTPTASSSLTWTTCTSKDACMSLWFRYRQVRVRQPVVPLGGRWVRPRPLVRVTLIGPADTYIEEAILDTAADDTVFPDMAAVKIGLDLSNAPTGEVSGVGLVAATVRYAEAVL